MVVQVKNKGIAVIEGDSAVKALSELQKCENTETAVEKIVNICNTCQKWLTCKKSLAFIDDNELKNCGEWKEYKR